MGVTDHDILTGLQMKSGHQYYTTLIGTVQNGSVRLGAPHLNNFCVLFLKTGFILRALYTSILIDTLNFSTS